MFVYLTVAESALSELRLAEDLFTFISFAELSVNSYFIFLSMYTYNDVGQVLALFIVTNAAAETAIGLSLLIVSYRLSTSINYEALVTLRG